MCKGLVINDYGAIIREEPDNKSKSVGTVDIFDMVDVVESDKGWRKIIFEGVCGYVPSKFVSITGL